MATQCYSLVRGSAIRVTGLTKRGAIPSPVRYVATRSVTRVSIDEVTESGGNEVQRNPNEESRVLLVTPTMPIRHLVSIEFIRTDPDILNLVSGVPVVTNAAGDVVGFNANTRVPAAAFALEVWAKITGSACSEPQQWGYTLFPFLRGGVLTGFTFADNTVSFNLSRAQSRRFNRWNVGPYDLEGPHQRLLTPVSGNGSWRQFLTTAPPPAQTDGAVEFMDVIDGGTVTMTSDDVLDGGTPAVTTPYIVDGGRP